jgi:multidrug efflux pump subunit AcrB
MKSLVVLLGFAAIPENAGDKGTAEPKSETVSAVIIVEAVYPGASATVVAETVAVPIELQLTGIANRLRLESRSIDGRCLLSVSFRPWVDLKKGMTAIQERVNLAAPTLPEPVRKRGVTIRTRTPVRFLITLSAINAAYDARFLSAYATLQIKNEFARLPGVGETRLIGDSRWRLRVLIDADQLRARNLTLIDVLKAVQEYQPAAAANEADLPPQFEDVVVTVIAGHVVRLKDVARLEIGAEVDGQYANFNGLPCVAIAISPTADANLPELKSAIERKLNELRPNLPARTRLGLAFDGSSRAVEERSLSLEIHSPEGASREHTARRLYECGELVRSVAGVKESLILSSNPFDHFGGSPSLIVGLEPTQSREEVVKTLEAKLNGFSDLTFRWRGLKRNFVAAVCGPDAGKTRELADKFVERLRRNQTLSRVTVDPASSLRPHLRADVDREKAKAMGVSLDDVGRAIDVALRSPVVREMKAVGRTTPVVVQIGERLEPAEALDRLSVRNDKAQLVPLSTLATVNMIAEPAAIDRIDMRFALRISGEATVDNPRIACEALFEEVRRETGLSDDYRLVWPL